VWCCVDNAAELGDCVRCNVEGLADGAHDFEGDALGLAGLEKVNRAQGDVSLAGQGALTQQVALADRG
jgi:hypothetical protein